MTSFNSLKREVEILSKALNTAKPKPQTAPINLADFTDSEQQTLLRAEEILTNHELNPRLKPFCIHGEIPTITEEYSETEKETILAAYHLVTNYRATENLH
jgi:hypothetical protein